MEDLRCFDLARRARNSRQTYLGLFQHAEVMVTTLDDWEKEWARVDVGLLKTEAVLADFKAEHAEARHGLSLELAMLQRDI